MKNGAWLIEGLFSLHGKEVEDAFRQAVQHALWQHKRLGNPVAVWKDGQVVIVPPDEIEIDPALNDLEIVNRNTDRLNAAALEALAD